MDTTVRSAAEATMVSARGGVNVFGSKNLTFVLASRVGAPTVALVTFWCPRHSVRRMLGAQTMEQPQMMDLELEALNALPEAKRRQLSWLFECRRYVASVGCELWCFGMTDLQPVDRHIVELEESIADLIVDPDLTVVLMAEYVVADAARVHQRGRPPVDFDCSVCRTGYYGIDQMLARLPDRPGSIDLDL